ncbi:hypothetical protein N6P31_01180 [Pectobacterium betavasculorum]|uniref:hypothetical protein n=1 Tax=Pectobacterium betavasculorum TaxID=55207 RepID=UPI00313DDF63
MSKSLNARCIRRWKVHFKPLCDSKVSPWWRKRDLRGYIRNAALTTADCMVYSLAVHNAKLDFDGSPSGWSPEFSEWFDARRDEYIKAARDYLNENASNDDVDEEIESELECWND